ncbi:MAG: hypothetical protein ACE5JH_11620 [Acidobacteriota bacterium]
MRRSPPGDPGALFRPFLRRVAVAILLATVPAAASPAEAAGTILGFSLDPDSPTTGDPVVFRAEIELTTCCTQPAVSFGFGLQEELGPDRGWGIDVDVASGNVPLITVIPVSESLGTLPLAAAPGVLRLRVDGVVEDVRFFDLAVSVGPAPGWKQIALHGGFTKVAQSTALAALPDRIAISDVGRRLILLVDPRTGQTISSFLSPGSGDVRGLAYDGTDLWVSVLDLGGPRAYRVDLLGRVLDFFPTPVISPGNSPLEGLAYRDGVLYGSYPGPPFLFAIDPDTGARMWERPLATRMQGLAPTPAGLLGVEPTGQFYLVEASAGGGDLLLADAADHGIDGLPAIEGLAFDGYGIFAWDASRARAMFMRSFALWWGLDGTLQAYVPDGGRSTDVLRGSVGGLLQLSGNVGLGSTLCLVANGAGGTVPTEDDPAEGEAFFYLSRFESAGGFDQSYGRSSLGFRRFDFADACP